jgi:hypothetical protein
LSNGATQSGLASRSIGSSPGAYFTPPAPPRASSSSGSQEHSLTTGDGVGPVSSQSSVSTKRADSESGFVQLHNDGHEEPTWDGVNIDLPPKGITVLDIYETGENIFKYSMGTVRQFELVFHQNIKMGIFESKFRHGVHRGQSNV